MFESFNKTYSFLMKVLYILGDSKKKLPIIFALYLFSTLFELFGLSLLGSFVILILNYNSENYFLFKFIGNFIEINFDRYGLIIINSFLLFFIFLIKAFFGIYMNYLVSKFVNQKIALLRFLLLDKFLRMSYSIYLSKHSSDFIISISSYVGRYGLVLQNLLRMASDSLITLVIFIFLFLLNPIIMINLIFVLTLIIIIYYKFYLFKLKNLGRDTNLQQKNLYKLINEGIEGLKEIRILGISKFFINNVKKSSEYISKNEIALSVISSAPRYLIELLLTTFVVSSIIMAIFFNYSLEIIIPTLAIFTLASIRILPMVYQFVNSYSIILFSSDGVEKLYEDFKFHNSEINESNNYRQQLKNNEIENLNKIELINIFYKYPSSEKYILNNVNFKIHKGDSIGIVGKSGEGKTTFVDVLLKLLEIEKGKIEYNSKELNETNIENWRSKIAYLPQQVFLINDTITSNIALGLSKEEINFNKIKKAISYAQLDSFLENLPNGLNTFIGERGIRMSGGQRQRMALARAFYFDKEVIILDESTSSLDKNTENEILERIKLLKNTKTLIVIAHRETTVSHCDTIIKIENGKIVKIK